jgi:hypothetical protein
MFPLIKSAPFIFVEFIYIQLMEQRFEPFEPNVHVGSFLKMKRKMKMPISRLLFTKKSFCLLISHLVIHATAEAELKLPHLASKHL